MELPNIRRSRLFRLFLCGCVESPEEGDDSARVKTPQKTSIWARLLQRFSLRKRGKYDVGQAEKNQGEELDTFGPGEAGEKEEDDLISLSPREKTVVKDEEEEELWPENGDKEFGPETCSDCEEEDEAMPEDILENGKELVERRASDWSKEYQKKEEEVARPCVSDDGIGAEMSDWSKDYDKETEEKEWVTDDGIGSKVSDCSKEYREEERNQRYFPKDKDDEKYQAPACTESTSTPPEKQEKKAPEIGHVQKRYTMGQELSQGAFGIVYAATRSEDGLKVAVKRVKKSRYAAPIKVPGYDDPLPLEIALTLMANSGQKVPQIIELLDWEDKAGRFLMVMECPSPCMDLIQFMTLRGGSVDEKTTRYIMFQAAHAAIVCCQRGVFHRDIKPENILINPETFDIKLIDFGCGALMQEEAYEEMSGTPDYFPPEYLCFGQCKAKPATVWSLGVMLFVLLCGRHPTNIDLESFTGGVWYNPCLTVACCKMLRECLKQDPEARIMLEELMYHEWFKTGV